VPQILSEAVAVSLAEVGAQTALHLFHADGEGVFQIAHT